VKLEGEHMKQYINWGLICCLICFGFNSFAQDIAVSAKLDTATIALGDQTILRLNATLPINGKVDFPALSDTISSKVQLIDIGKLDTLKDEGNPSKWKLSRAYTITSFDAGIQTIPSFTFTTAEGELKTESLPLQVQAVAVDTTKAVYDIKQPLTVTYGLLDWLKDNAVLVSLGIVVLLLIIGLWYYIRKRKKDSPVVVQVEPSVSAYERALSKLKLLEDQELWQKDQVKLYHSELTDIIREFLEKRYQIRAMEQTSDEIFACLSHMEIPEQNWNRLRQVLTLADLVKFAKEKPLNTDNEQSMENAISFVKEAGEINKSIEDKMRDRDEHI